MIASPTDIRRDFPALSVQVHGHPVAYLDNAATSQKPQVVLDRMQRYYQEENANVHRGVHTLSQLATTAFEAARDRIQAYIGAASRSEIIFTRGTTDAINLVASSWGRTHLGPGKTVLLSEMEHHSNIVPWQLICAETGARVRAVHVLDNGELDYEDYQRALMEDDVAIVSVVHASNTLGTVNPVKRMVSDAHAMGIPVLLDGAQALPHGPVDVQDLDCDFYCFSSHKVFGPTGFGVLYGKEALLDAMPPYQGGGDMIEDVDFGGTTFNELPYKFEAGTPHIAGAIGLAAALDYVESLGHDWIRNQEQELLAYATRVLADLPGLRIVGTAGNKVSVVSFLLGNAHPYDVGTILDRMGIAVRTGHHCTQPLMKRYGIPGTVRASFAFYNTMEEVDRLVNGLHKAHSMLS